MPDIDNLEPGPETDALVAEALGWTHRLNKRGRCMIEVPGYSWHRVFDVWEPSTDWRAAMEAWEMFCASGVLEQMHPEGTVERVYDTGREYTDNRAVIEFTTEHPEWKHCVAGYRVAIETFNSDDYYVHEWRETDAVAHDPSGPLAICKAILKAKQ
jgi:hypothetical protein